MNNFLESPVGRHAIIEVMGNVLSSNHLDLLETYNELGDLANHDALAYPDHIQIHQDFESPKFYPSDLFDHVNDQVQALVDFASFIFQSAKEAIVAKTIDCTLDGDMNSLYMDGLVEYADVINSKYISDVGDLVVHFDTINSMWTTDDKNFEVDCDWEGLPNIDLHDNEYQLEDGTTVHLTSFTKIV